MAPPVNKLGRPPDVTALIVTKEIDVTIVPRGSVETVVNNVRRGSREMIAKNVHSTTMGMIVVMICYNFKYKCKPPSTRQVFSIQ